MRRVLVFVIAVAGLLFVGASPAAAKPGSDSCTTSTWHSALRPAERWIIKRESNFSPTADNPTSSAFGLGQLILANRLHYAPLVGSTAAETTNWGTTVPCHQLGMMRLYIEDRYGSPRAAKKFWKQNHWY
jgi:hypothetical protein